MLQFLLVHNETEKIMIHKTDATVSLSLLTLVGVDLSTVPSDKAVLD